MDEADMLSSALLEALPYINYFAGKTLVIKVGGSTLGSGDTTLQDIVWLKNLGIEPVIVHGGGADISLWLKRLGVEPRFVQGLRVTDEPTMEVVRMVLVGKVNTELISTINALGGKALGISGLDGGLIQAEIEDPQLGLVGRITAINLELLNTIVGAGYIVVIAPIGTGPAGQPLNLNADTVAGEIARTLRAEKLIVLSDVAGILDSNGQLLSHISAAQAQELIQSQAVSGGMIPKVRACLRALEGVKRTHIIDGRVPHALIRELFTDRGVGTMITQVVPNGLAPSKNIEYLLDSMKNKRGGAK